MRIGESLSLRIKDIDFELARIDIQDGKGGKGRVLMLPNALRADLRNLIGGVARQHKSDMERGAGRVSLPDALHLKKPKAGYELGWQFLFNSRTLTRDPATKRRGRFHLSLSALQKAFRVAVKRSGSLKPASCHTLRHSFAAEILKSGYDLPTLRDLLGHDDIRTTMTYTHVVDQVGMGVRSPLGGGASRGHRHVGGGVMKVYTYSEARRWLARVLDEARAGGEIRIKRRDGSEFSLRPVSGTASPLDVPGVDTDVSCD